MRFYQTIVFIIAFNMNVTLKASAQIIEEPRECWSSEKVCAVKAAGVRGSRKIGVSIIDFPYAAIFRRDSMSKVRLIKGSFFIRAKNELKVETKYASIHFKKGQSAYVKLNFSQVDITSFSGNLKITDIKGGEYTLPQSYTNWIGKNNIKNRVESGFPRPANLANLIKNIGALTSQNKAGLYEGLVRFKKTWERAIDETQGRSIASSNKLMVDWENRKKYLAKRRARELKKRKEMREFFFRKTFLE